jgi:Amt family ammonium transporter
MKHLFAILALLGAVAIGAPAWADETSRPGSAQRATRCCLAQAARQQRQNRRHRREAAARQPVRSARRQRLDHGLRRAGHPDVDPGLALFYGGLVRTKNMLSVLMQVFVTFSLISVLWVVYGYSLAFTEGGSFFGVLDKVFLKGITADSLGATFSKGVFISELTFVIFQGAFAAITCGLIVGAFAERAKFAAILVFMVIWFTLSYLPMAHMVWYWAGPDAYIDAAAGEAAGARPPASCSRKALSTSPAVPWCISTPLSPVWSAPS